MTPALSDLKRTIADCELHHPFFVEQFEPLSRIVNNWLAGDIASVEWVIGPSRIGKTMLTKAIARDHPEVRENGHRHVPVVRLELRSSVSPHQLPASVLRGLKVPVPRVGSAGDRFDYMAGQLERAKARVILLGEASHVVEPGSRVPPSAAGDWFKDVVEQLNISLVLSGVPRLRRLISSNSQLKGRAGAARIFRPYDYGVEAERDAYAACVKTYLDLFAKAGYPIAMPFELFVMHSYLVGAGSIGMLSKFLYKLADRVTAGPCRPVTFADCAWATSQIEVAGHPSCPGFVRDKVSLVELRQAYVYAMEEAELSLTSLRK